MTLSPNEQFPIARQIDDVSDVNTYYPQAVIRDARTNTTIDTVNLDLQTSQYYLGLWEVCPDPSGLGRYISVTIYVYTDSGHTTLSELYSVTSQTYLIQARTTPHFGGGGVDIDYKKIRKIIEEVVEEKKVEIILTPLEESIASGFESLLNKIDRIEIKDLTSEIRQVEKEIKNNIAQIKFPEIPKIPPYPKQEKVDLSPLEDKLELLGKLILKIEEDNSKKEVNLKNKEKEETEEKESRKEDIKNKMAFIEKTLLEGDFKKEKVIKKKEKTFAEKLGLNY